jgi:hypothetical protein
MIHCIRLHMIVGLEYYQPSQEIRIDDDIHSSKNSTNPSTAL